MRDAFVNKMLELAARNDRLILITGDLGFGIFNEFTQRFPKQFLNVGVCEQNMIGVATGMALEGWTVFTYSIGNFGMLRCLEQIRNDAAYHEVNVNIITSGGGFTYGGLGMSHHATEDLSLLRALPGITVVAPCDAFESSHATEALAARPGVGYLRIEKETPLKTGELGGEFVIGKARRISEGTDISLISSGGIVHEAMLAADALQKMGYQARVVSLHTLKPVDREEIRDCIDHTRGIITIEENTICGGLGGAVAEIVAEAGGAGFFRRIGMDDIYSSVVGSQDYLRQYYRLDSSAIIETASEILRQNSQKRALVS